MSQNFQNSAMPPNERFNPGRLVLFVAAVGLLGFIVYKYYFADSTYSNIPKEVQIKYVPSDFKADIDYDNALPILANPERYSREFDQLIHDFNLSLLNHVANRMDLSDSLKIRVRQEYEKHHPYIQKLMFNDFVSMRDSSSSLYNTWYQNELTGAVDMLNEVASKYTCFLINQIMATLIPTQEGKIYVKGKSVDTPCGVALA